MKGLDQVMRLAIVDQNVSGSVFACSRKVSERTAITPPHQWLRETVLRRGGDRFVRSEWVCKPARGRQRR